jgi:hypothetical protein
MKGSLKIILKNMETGIEEIYEGNNIIVSVASELMAELMRGIISDPLRTQVDGIRTLAVGTGGIGWDLQNPPAATITQTQLENELYRKEFDSVNYIDTLGNVSPVRTNVIDLTTVFDTTEANGALVEMGLFGGTDSTLPNNGSMINYYTMPVINKISGSNLLTIIWRISL